MFLRGSWDDCVNENVEYRMKPVGDDLLNERRRRHNGIVGLCRCQLISGSNAPFGLDYPRPFIG